MADILKKVNVRVKMWSNCRKKKPDTTEPSNYDDTEYRTTPTMVKFCEVINIGHRKSVTIRKIIVTKD